MIFDLFFQVFVLFIFSLLLAALEVQIEGKAGWATNLPTWKPKQSVWYARFYRKLMAGKDMTGYHIFLFTLILLFFHYPYFSGMAWSLVSELTTISLFILFVIFEDFLWFVINPRYDFGSFWAEQVWWHKKWFLHLPVDYWFGFIVSALFYMRFSWNLILFQEWLEMMILFLIFVLIAVIFAIATGVFRVKQNTDK